MKPLPTDSCDFPKIRTKGQIYVDKTRFLYNLVTDPNGELFFISRPRRFGKSLMISTLKAIFQGQRELFDGLYISQTNYDWPVHPVIHLNMGNCSRGNFKAFYQSISVLIQDSMNIFGLEYDQSRDFADNFGKMIDVLASRGAKPVILIDEYDDPVAQVINHAEEAEKVRTALGPLYRKIKEQEGKIRFVMVTGVSKFTKMSIFSVLSNIQDISLYDEYASMLGFTEKELDLYYSDYMAAQAARMGITSTSYRNELKRMYNGYRFWRYEGESVYNPVSITLNLSRCEPFFLSFWSETGRPSMLMNFLNREDILSIDPECVRSISQQEFDVTSLNAIPVKGLLFQTGYLTIKDYTPLTASFTLCIPNEEVRRDFALVMASLCAQKSVAWAASIGKMLLLGDWENFYCGLKALYAGIAYGPHEKRIHEHSYARCLMFLLQGQGIICAQEVTQADGRVDMLCTHPCGIFIFELKVDKPASVAMGQMERKKYAEPYSADSRPIWLIGLSFNSNNRHLVDCQCEKYMN